MQFYPISVSCSLPLYSEIFELLSDGNLSTQFREGFVAREHQLLPTGDAFHCVDGASLQGHLALLRHMLISVPGLNFGMFTSFSCLYLVLVSRWSAACSTLPNPETEWQILVAEETCLVIVNLCPSSVAPSMGASSGRSFVETPLLAARMRSLSPLCIMLLLRAISFLVIVF